MRHTLGGPTMGASYSAAFYAAPGFDAAAVAAALFAAVDTVDRQMSNWTPHSDLNRLCAAPPGDWVDLPAPLLAVLEAGLQVGRASGGAFDMAVADLVAAWGFGPPVRMPDPARIRALTGERHIAAEQGVELDPAAGRARRLAQVRLDLSGIAKGFGVDAMADCLRAHGITDFVVGIDGELRASGYKPGGLPWTVAIEQPVPGAARGVIGHLDLVNRAIATSGDYRNQIVLGDTRLSHTMDPASMRPLQNGVASVSVLAESCMMADAWATALMVMGARAGAEFAR
ncbi:MAG: FAD:protein FMN transferase, partial [Paracoccaceae bacterium]|nr:FAD:protein FMN transferase [Paracoccaceae bacterium]